jgi:hypothetical protein
MRDIQNVPSSRPGRDDGGARLRTLRCTGHDRGAHRRRDHLERGERVALLDIVPTLYRFETIDQKAAMSSWRWFFLIQPTQTSAEPATRQTMPALFCCFGIERIRCYSIVQGFKFR